MLPYICNSMHKSGKHPWDLGEEGVGLFVWILKATLFYRQFLIFYACAFLREHMQIHGASMKNEFGLKVSTEE